MFMMNTRNKSGVSAHHVLFSIHYHKTIYYKLALMNILCLRIEGFAIVNLGVVSKNYIDIENELS